MQSRKLLLSAFAFFSLAAFLVATLVTARQALADPSSGGGGGRGGGFGIGINIAPLIEQGIRRREREPDHVPTRTTCPGNQVPSRNGCVCPRGTFLSGGKCMAQPTTTHVPQQPNVNVVKIQECLTKIGHDTGGSDGTAGKQTLAAWREFQVKNGLAKQPANLNDDKTTKLLYQQCDKPQLASTNPMQPTRSLGTSDKNEACLPQDLLDMLTKTYGRRPNLAACPTACLPRPATMTQTRLDTLTRAGVKWCDSCIQLGAWLPLSSVLSIERAANVTLCASPGSCYIPAATGQRNEVRTIFRTLPRSLRNDGDIAVVVGNENYTGKGLPPNPNGLADATAVKTLLVEQLGYKEQNVIDLRDAKLADLERVFGGKDGASELGKRIAKDSQANVLIYVSSHGVAQESNAQAYLLPVEASFETVDKTAYPLQQLYANLGKIGARSIMLILEADFARNVGELIDPPNLPQLAVNAMPEQPVPGLAVFKASDRDQRTLEDPEYGIGLFTRYIIEGLAGKADTAPIGNGDTRIDAVELFVYTADLVRTAARKSHGVEQKPLLSEIGNLVVGQLAAR